MSLMTLNDVKETVNDYDSAPIIEVKTNHDKNIDIPLIQMNNSTENNVDNNNATDEEDKNNPIEEKESKDDELSNNKYSYKSFNKYKKKNNNNKNNTNENIKQNVILLNGPKRKREFLLPVMCGNISLILTIIFMAIFILITIADIVIQFINPNGLNNYLIDDCILISFLLSLICQSSHCISCMGCIAFVSYIGNIILFFKYFLDKNRNPLSIYYFYISYFIIKLTSAVLSLIFMIIFGFSKASKL